MLFSLAVCISPLAFVPVYRLFLIFGICTSYQNYTIGTFGLIGYVLTFPIGIGLMLIGGIAKTGGLWVVAPSNQLKESMSYQVAFWVVHAQLVLCLIGLALLAKSF